MKQIQKVGVVGAGTMGSALAQKFSQQGFEVILCDLSMQQVEKGLSGIRKMLEEGVERGVFTEGQKTDTLQRIAGTDEYQQLAGCDLVIEAVFENLEVKKQLFERLSGIVPQTTILATNTSSFSVTELAEAVTHPERFIGLHFFYHAAKNRLVEIIPGEKTSQQTLESCYRFALLAGKDPIFTKDRYGFAVNRFFVPWLNESVRLLELPGASPAIIDQVAVEVFGIGMGPFALMNATGVPIALHAQRTLQAFGPSYQPALKLEQQVNAGKNWDIGEAGSPIAEDLKKAITERLLGVVFFVCSQILKEEVCSAAELDRGARIGLRWKRGPVAMMEKAGKLEVEQLVRAYCSRYGEAVPAIDVSRWARQFVFLRKMAGKALITIDRPEDLNALNEQVMKELDACFRKAGNDPDIRQIFITGVGKAFVAGADIGFFLKNMKKGSLDKIVEFTKYGQEVFNRIDHSSKEVIAVLNGLTLGGGLELALCCDRILAYPSAKMAFPETGIGIYPGLGGTQRTSARVGKGLAKYLILTGQMLDADTALSIGLVDAIVQPVEFFSILDGEADRPVSEGRQLPEEWSSISQLYASEHISDLVEKQVEVENHLMAKALKSLRRKAPLALKIAESLIEEGKGPESELEQLPFIFKTNDALKGLSSLGRGVEYQGN
ncbi:MAG: 3-hydroxyacyl-CoA dehydrogenase/enoyl-CoA hydratase family protein [Saprospiraceae bacterium]